MSAFNKSFEESFKTGQATGAAASLEAIKEKIKLEQTKAEEASSVVEMKNQILSLRDGIASKGGDTSVIDNIMSGLDKSNKKEVVEPIYKAVLDTAKQGPYEQLIAQGKAAEASTNILEAGGIPPPLNLPGMNQQSVMRGASQMQPVQGTTQNNISSLVSQSQIGQGDLVPTDFNVAGVATKYKSRSGMAAEEQSKVDAKNREKVQKAENTSAGTNRFMQQFQRSYDELKSFDPEVDKVGVGGYLSRTGAKIAEHLDELPETKALKIQILPLANGMAREIEGGRVTDNDRKIYADSFASAINFPTVTNVRNMSTQIIGLIDKGGDENGKITNQLKELAKSDSDIFRRVISQVIVEFPEMAKSIYGEDYEVIDED